MAWPSFGEGEVGLNGRHSPSLCPAGPARDLPWEINCPSPLLGTVLFPGQQIYSYSCQTSVSLPGACFSPHRALLAGTGAGGGPPGRGLGCLSCPWPGGGCTCARACGSPAAPPRPPGVSALCIYVHFIPQNNCHLHLCSLFPLALCGRHTVARVGTLAHPAPQLRSHERAPGCFSASF